jgi:copper resistance protein C
MKALHTFAIACAAAAILAAPYAAAHAVLKESSPAANSTVAAPREVSLLFNEKVEPAFSVGVGPDGHRRKGQFQFTVK